MTPEEFKITFKEATQDSKTVTDPEVKELIRGSMAYLLREKSSLTTSLVRQFGVIEGIVMTEEIYFAALLAAFRKMFTPKDAFFEKLEKEMKDV